MEMTFTDDNFDTEVLKADEPSLVDFWAPWCGPCKALGPILEEVAKEFDGKPVRIGKLNVDENQKVPSEFGIMSIPTIIFFKDGQPTEQLIGLQTKETLVEKLNGLIG